MSGKVSSKPAGYPSLTPYLIVRDTARAIDFYRIVFGAEPRMQLAGPGGRIGHAELAIGDSLIMLADESPEHGAVAPKRDQAGPISLHLYVDEADAVLRAAQAAGAKLVRPIETKFYGDRSATIADPFGHIWHISTHVEDVSPEEIERRAAALSK
jgi:PhnB protein